MNRLLAFLLVLTLVIGTTVSAFASNALPRIDFVATVQIVTYSGGGISSGAGIEGHAFLIVKNTSNSSITVGHMMVPKNDSVTLGSFGNRANHIGIWHNIEGYCASSSVTKYALATGVTGSELVSLNSAINSNDSWSYMENCCTFATNSWNSIASSGYQLFGANPAALMVDIRLKNGYVTNPIVPSKSLNEIARHTSSSVVYDPSGA